MRKLSRSFRGKLRGVPPAQRFWLRVGQKPKDECWPWRGGDLSGNGYGSLKIGGRHIQTHVFAYEMMVGPVPAGLELDHTCRNRACCNPAHLEPVTKRENILRGEGLAAENARKTHCIRGHELGGENTMPGQDGRRCRTCIREYQKIYQRERYLKAKAAKQAAHA